MLWEEIKPFAMPIHFIHAKPIYLYMGKAPGFDTENVLTPLDCAPEEIQKNERKGYLLNFKKREIYSRFLMSDLDTQNIYKFFFESKFCFCRLFSRLK